MAQKGKKAKGGKPKGNKTGALKVDGDGVSLAPLSAEMVKKIETLERLKDEEERQRNYAQLERNKVSDFYEITRRELTWKGAQLRCKDRQMEDVEERKMMELRVYKQKVKHLLYDHSRNTLEMKAEMQEGAHRMQEEWNKQEKELWEHVHQLKQQKREQEVCHENLIKEKSKEHAKELEVIRETFQQQLKQVAENHDKKLQSLLHDMEMKRKRDIHEIDGRKNKHIQEMLVKHGEDFTSIKNYYNDITHNSLDLLKALKDDVQMMRESEFHNEKLMLDLVEENRRMSSPLSLALKEVDALRQKLIHYEKDKASLARLRSRLVEANKTYRNLEFEHEVLQQRFDNLQKEKDTTHDQLEGQLYESSRINNLKEQISEKKIGSLRESLEIREAQIAEGMLATGAVPADTNKANDKIEGVIRQKNFIIQQLQLDIAKVSKAHNDLIRVYEAKLMELGVHPHTLGFRPLLTNVGSNPSGLVSGV